MRSAMGFGIGGSPCPRNNCCGGCFSGAGLIVGSSDSRSATFGAMPDFSWANGCEGDRTRRLSGRPPVGLGSGSMQCVV